MKLKTGTIIRHLDDSPFMTDQKPMLGPDNTPIIVGRMPLMTGGRPLTVGDVLSDILSTRKVNEYNSLKANALAKRFYKADVTEIDEGDYSSLRKIIEVAGQGEWYFPIVLAQIDQALIDAKDAGEKRKK